MSRGSCGRARSRPCAGPRPAAHRTHDLWRLGRKFRGIPLEATLSTRGIPLEATLSTRGIPLEATLCTRGIPLEATLSTRGAPAARPGPGAPSTCTPSRRTPAGLQWGRQGLGLAHWGSAWARPMIAVFVPGRPGRAGVRTRWPKLHPRVVRCTHAIVLYRRSDGLTPAGSSLTTSVPAAYPAATNAASHHDAPSITCAYLRALRALR
jgi:hypothetical protein